MTPCRAVAVVHPQETRTLVMRAVWLVLFVMRYECVRVGPTGTPPKSCASESNIPSAQDAADAGRANTTPATAARQNRYIVPLSLCPDPDARPQAGTPPGGSPGSCPTLAPGAGI